MKAGKALDSRKAEIRVQFKDVPGDIFKCKNFQWLLFFREVSVIICCCWKREGQAMQCRSVFWARVHCMGCWLTNLWFQGAFNLYKIMFCLQARIRDGMSLWWDCNHQRLCTWSLQYVTLNRILIFPVEGFSTRNAFSCNSKRGCRDFSSTLNVVACSHWNSAWFVWWVSSHCFPNSIHLMFGLSSGGLQRMLPAFWPSAGENMFDRWSNLVWKWKQHKVSWICHINSVIKMLLSLKLMNVLFWTRTPSMTPHYLYCCVISVLSLHNFNKLCHSSLFPAQIFLSVNICNLNPISISCNSADLQGSTDFLVFLRNCFSCGGRFLGDLVWIIEYTICLCWHISLSLLSL